MESGWNVMNKNKSEMYERYCTSADKTIQIGNDVYYKIIDKSHIAGQLCLYIILK